MDTAESEHSDLDETDIEWLQSDDFQDEMGRKRKQTAKKRYSKVVMETDSNTEAHKTSPTETEQTNPIQKSPSGICCSCSKSSSCKTQKCACRAINGLCSTTCGCHPKKCSNREKATVEESVLQPPVVSLSDVEEIEKESSELASHGALLLQAALSDKPAEVKDADGAKRRPLSDIGNKIGKSNAPRPGAPRKTWRKSVAIQLVPVSSDQPLSQTEETVVSCNQETEAPKKQDTEAPKKQETEAPKKQETSTIEPTKLRLPRAMRSAMSIANPPLRDRNSEPSNDSTINKEPDNTAPRSPRQHTRPTTEKENHGV